MSKRERKLVQLMSSEEILADHSILAHLFKSDPGAFWSVASTCQQPFSVIYGWQTSRQGVC